MTPDPTEVADDLRNRFFLLPHVTGAVALSAPQLIATDAILSYLGRCGVSARAFDRVIYYATNCDLTDVAERVEAIWRGVAALRTPPGCDDLRTKTLRALAGFADALWRWKG